MGLMSDMRVRKTLRSGELGSMQDGKMLTLEFEDE